MKTFSVPSECPECHSDMIVANESFWRCTSCGKTSTGIDTEPGLNSLKLKR